MNRRQPGGFLTRLCLWAAVITLTAVRAGAFSFEPMSVTFEPKGANAVKTYRLRNDSEIGSIAIKVSVTTRVVDANGVETNQDASADFTIFPTRFILETGATRALKVQYKGADPGRTEKAYRIIAEQVPADFSAQKSSGISVLIKYVGAVYIRGSNAAPTDIKAISAIGTEKDGKRGVSVTLRNDGGTHAIMTETKLELTAPDGKLLWLEGETANPLNGINMLAGNTRIVFIPTDAVEVIKYEPRLEYKVEQ